MSDRIIYHNVQNLDYFFDNQDKLNVSIPTKEMYIHCSYCDEPVLDILGILEYYKDEEILKVMKKGGIVICADCLEKFKVEE